MEQILTIAARTPDHGALTPWRFVTVSEDQREQLASLLLDALAQENPGATDAHREKEVSFAHYPGQLVVLIFAPVPDHKIPVWEQELSCGAACMNLLLAAHAMGFAGGWVTGWAAYSPEVRRGLGLREQERIAGFLFLGTPAVPLEERARPAFDYVVHEWVPGGSQ